MQQGSTSDNLPADFCSLGTVVLVAVIMVLLAVVMLLIPGQQVSAGWEELGMRAMFLQWLGLLSLAVLCLVSPLLRRTNLLISTVLTFLIIQLVTLAVSETVYQVVSAYTSLSYLRPTDHGLFLLRNVAISIIISGVALRYMYVQRQLQIQVRAENEARIQALQARIRPHFLFNSMNTIAALTHIDAYAAEKAIIDLSEIFRASLQSDDAMTTLDEEIALAKHYLEVEALRLHERLSIHWQVDEGVGHIAVPRLILQPLVENAVYHGIEPRPEGGEISITVGKSDDRVLVEINNPLPEGNDDRMKQGNQMAMKNIHDRLAITYGSQARLSSVHEGELYRVTLELPLKVQ